MVTIKRVNLGIDLKFVKLGADFEEDDRQAAWELYAELSTRVSLVGKTSDPDCTDFSGERYDQSLDSLYAFFREARKIMRMFPVGRLGGKNTNHLGILIHRVLNEGVRPFLEKWQTPYRDWWEHESNLRKPPFERQQDFPQLGEFLSEWAGLRFEMRELQARLVKEYQLVDVDRGA